MSEAKTVDEFINATKDVNQSAAYNIGQELGEAIINHIDRDIFMGEAVIIAIGLFNDNQSLTEQIDTVPFFQDNRQAIIAWLERCTPNKNPLYIGEKFAETLTNISGRHFSAGDVQAVIFDNDRKCREYKTIADQTTKTLARAVALWCVRDSSPTLHTD